MFRTGYEVFIHSFSELAEGKELDLEIKDCQSYRTKVVKALVSSSEAKLPQGEKLWVRSALGHLVSEEPWRIKITKVIEER